MEAASSTGTPNEKKNRNNTPRIYVASLADYNAGDLLGCWIDADQPAEAIRDGIAQMLAQSTQPVAEEWAIHDYENFGGLSVSEFESLECVSEVACGIVEHGMVFGALVSHFGGAANVEEARRYMDDGYRGAFKSLADYAADFVEACYGDVLKAMPEFLRYHIDYDGLGRDLELGGDVFTIESEGDVHIFDANP